MLVNRSSDNHFGLEKNDASKLDLLLSHMFDIFIAYYIQS